jgi:hypothetical protein
MTGREIILKAANGIVSFDDAERIAKAIGALGYVCVPREPTSRMMKGAYFDALAEDAAGVWRTMIGVYEGTVSDSEIDGLVKEAETP